MAYKYTNSKGVSYYLNTKKVIFGGKPRSVYFFSKDLREDTACDMPEGYKAVENKKNGFVMAAKIRQETNS